MFELAGLSAFLDIFQKAFGLIEKHKDQKRRLFTDIVEPIYKELSVVVDEYYAFFRGCRDELSQTDMSEWEEILNAKRKQREEIILARNKVLGFVEPFVFEYERQQRINPEKQKKEDELLYNFAHGINSFFYASDPPEEGLPLSVASSLFESIDWILRRPRDPELMDLIRGSLALSIMDMEESWRNISQAYGELRIHCLT